jgi:hypothetical protein
MNLGDVAWNQGRREEAVASGARSIELHTAAVRRAKDFAEYRQWLRRSYDRLGMFYRELGQLEQAVELAVQRAAAAAGDAEELFATAVEVARCHKLTAAPGQPLSDEQLALQDRYARQALEILAKAIDAGLGDAGRLETDAELVSLRGIEGFAELIERAKPAAGSKRSE